MQLSGRGRLRPRDAQDGFPNPRPTRPTRNQVQIAPSLKKRNVASRSLEPFDWQVADLDPPPAVRVSRAVVPPEEEKGVTEPKRRVRGRTAKENKKDDRANEGYISDLPLVGPPSPPPPQPASTLSHVPLTSTSKIARQLEEGIPAKLSASAATSPPMRECQTNLGPEPLARSSPASEPFGPGEQGSHKTASAGRAGLQQSLSHMMWLSLSVLMLGMVVRGATWLSLMSPATGLRVASSGVPSLGAKLRTMASAGSSPPGASASGPPAPPPPPSTSPAQGPSLLVSVVPAESMSPYKEASWHDVISHMAERLTWTDSNIHLKVFTEEQLKDPQGQRQFESVLKTGPPIFVGMALTDPQVAQYLLQHTAVLPTALFFDSSPELEAVNHIDNYRFDRAPGWQQAVAQLLPFSHEAKAKEVLTVLSSLWQRQTSDDLLYIFLVLVNAYQQKVPLVANTAKGMDLEGLKCIFMNCRKQVVDCVTDTTCKTALDCLNGCFFNDQVCQYRCIVSYESPKFGAFGLCILQLHNCRNLFADIPMTPNPHPMTSFRGKPLDHHTAEELFVGWLSPELTSGHGEMRPYSWLIASGKNPAYDYFPCQHQLYYRGKGQGQLWYEPVFKVITLDDRQVWRRRRYRVRRGTEVGTFHYSVLDNGVTSNEFWRILDCADDLSFCLFYYSGAASAAGLSYQGAVLGTPDGRWPSQHTTRIQEALDRAGIKMWELTTANNENCADAPLALGNMGTPAMA